MGIFDGIFNNSTQQEAAQQQIGGLNNAYNNASSAINTGQATTNATYAKGMEPFTKNLEVTQAGQGDYANATGVNGATGYAEAMNKFRTAPGYSFQLEQGNENVLRNQSRTGQLASGQTNLDLQKFGQGMADQSWQQYIQNLLPFVGASTANAQGTVPLTVAQASTQAQAANKLADMGWQKETGIGNANANATLAEVNANGNIVNAGLGAAKMLAGFL